MLQIMTFSLTDLGQRVKKESQEGNVLAETTSCQPFEKHVFERNAYHL